MKNASRKHTNNVRIAMAAVALIAAFILTVMPVAAGTINATDVTIRSSDEQRDDNVIGILQMGDRVIVISRTTDSTGTEWYFIQLPNGNFAYVKAMWVDTDEQDVLEEETAAPEENMQEETGKDDEGDEEKRYEDDELEKETDTIATTPVSGNDAGTETEDGEGKDTTADSQGTPDVENGQEFDPYTDPNAHYNVTFSTEEDGTGYWYVYNYDTDKRIRVSDLEELDEKESALQKSTSETAFWRRIACVLVVFQLLMIILLLWLTACLRSVLRKNSSNVSDFSKNHRRQGSLADNNTYDEKRTVTWTDHQEL